MCRNIHTREGVSNQLAEISDQLREELASDSAFVNVLNGEFADETAGIPIYYYLSRNVVSPKVKGFVDNAFDIHRTRWLEIVE